MHGLLADWLPVSTPLTVKVAALAMNPVVTVTVLAWMAPASVSWICTSGRGIAVEHG